MNTNTEIKTLEQRVGELPFKAWQHSYMSMYELAMIDETAELRTENTDLRAEIARLQGELSFESSALADAVRHVCHLKERAALADRDAKQVQGELPPLTMAVYGTRELLDQERQRRSAIAQRVGCGEPAGEPLAVLTLGGIVDDEFDSWDLEVYSGNAIDLLQEKLVRSSKPVTLNLYAYELTPPAAVTDAARDKLLAIIGACYQIAGTHDCPEHVLDVLCDPEAATTEQVDALLPYSVEQATDAEKRDASLFEQAAQACDQQADGTNGPYRSACLQCADAVRELRDASIEASSKGGIEP